MAGYASGHARIAAGTPAEAVADLQAAARLWSQLEAPYETARCRALLGLALRGLGDDESATAELTAAAAAFARLGATSDEREVSALLGHTAPNGLTTREVEVLRLVAAGLSNPDIATRLFLSEKTVARHLSNIFGKLDVRSRTAAAAFAFEHHLV
jgi:DNA-binding NarL/FixJ family response regulator